MTEPISIYRVSRDEARALLARLGEDLEDPNLLGVVAVAIHDDGNAHNVSLYVCSPQNRLSALEVRGALDMAKDQVDDLRGLGQ